MILFLIKIIYLIYLDIMKNNNILNKMKLEYRYMILEIIEYILIKIYHMIINYHIKFQ